MKAENKKVGFVEKTSQYVKTKYYSSMAATTIFALSAGTAHADKAEEIAGRINSGSTILVALYKFFPLLVIMAGAYGTYWGYNDFMKGMKTDNREGNKTRGAIVFVAGVVGMSYMLITGDLSALIGNTNSTPKGMDNSIGL